MKKILCIVLIAAVGMTVEAKNKQLFEATRLAEELQTVSNTTSQDYDPLSAYVLSLQMDSIMRQASKRTLRKLEKKDINVKWTNQVRKDACQAAYRRAQRVDAIPSYTAFLETYTKAPVALKKAAQQSIERLTKPIIKYDTIVQVEIIDTGKEIRWKMAHDAACESADIQDLVDFRKNVGYEDHEGESLEDAKIVGLYNQFQKANSQRDKVILEAAPYKIAYDLVVETIAPLIKTLHFKRAYARALQFELCFGNDRSYRELLHLLHILTLHDSEIDLDNK